MELKRKVDGINLIRILGMSMILLFHARLLYGFRIGVEPVDNIFSIGAICVTVFFILSGFGLRKSNRELRIFDMTTRFGGMACFNWAILGKYMVKRLVSIYPLYLLLQVVAILFAFRVDGFVENSVWLIPVQLTMTQVVVGSDVYGYLFNDNCWYISALFVLYLLFPLLNESVNFLNKHIELWNKKTKCGLLVSLIIGLCVLSEGIYLYQVFVCEGSQFLDYYPNPIFRIPEFYVGMLAAELCEELPRHSEEVLSKPSPTNLKWTRWKSLSVMVLVTCLILTVLGLLALHPHFGLEYNLYNILVIPCTVSSIICIAGNEWLNRIGGSKVARWISGMGLEMYLCQSFAILLIERVGIHEHHDLWFIVLSIVIAVVIHMVFTRNVQKWLRKRGGR